MVFLPIMVLAAASTAAAATPAPTLPPVYLKTIVNIKAKSLCTNLHNVIMPFVVIERENNVRFKSMDVQLGIYHKWYRPTSDAATDPNGSPEINGAQALAASRIDQTAAMMYKDITHAEDLISQSERAVPHGKDPKLDDLRDRARSILEVQRQIADRYEEQAGTYLNSLGALPPVPDARSVAGDPALQSTLDLPQLDEDPLAAARDPSHGIQIGLQTPPPGSQYGEQPHAQASKQIVHSMVIQEFQFVTPALKAVKECDGP